MSDDELEHVFCRQNAVDPVMRLNFGGGRSSFFIVVTIVIFFIYVFCGGTVQIRHDNWFRRRVQFGRTFPSSV